MTNTGIRMLLLILLLAPTAQGLDGMDRTRAGGPHHLLQLFPAPQGERWGYRFAPSEEPDGSDDQRYYHWARPEAVALIRLAAFRTAAEMGPTELMLPIFDLSCENGDTPATFEAGETPRARHPGNSHDGGFNLDLGYYLTSLEGLHESPDYSACSDHYQAEPDEEGNPRDAYQCMGLPDRLDLDRQALFLLRLFQLDRELFAGEWIAAVGIDWEVQRAAMTRLEEWARAGSHGSSVELIQAMKERFTADPFGGWARFHHHHLHLRLGDLETSGRYGPAFRELLEQERAMDRELLTEEGPGDQPVLLARLYSYGLSRSVEVELMGRVFGDHVRFRWAGGDWVKPDPSDWYRIRAELDLPGGPVLREEERRLEAEIAWPDQEPEILSRTLTIPRRDPHLYVSVDPHDIRTTWEEKEGRWSLSLSYPPIFDTYVTGAAFLVYRADGTETLAERLPLELPVREASFQQPADGPPVVLIQAEVTLCRSMRRRVSVYCRSGTVIPAPEPEEPERAEY